MSSSEGEEEISYLNVDAADEALEDEFDRDDDGDPIRLYGYDQDEAPFRGISKRRTYPSYMDTQEHNDGLRYSYYVKPPLIEEDEGDPSSRFFIGRQRLTDDGESGAESRPMYHSMEHVGGHRYLPDLMDVNRQLLSSEGTDITQDSPFREFLLVGPILIEYDF